LESEHRYEEAVSEALLEQSRAHQADLETAKEQLLMEQREVKELHQVNAQL